MGNLFTTFTNCRLCINGQLVDGQRLVVSQDTGEILKSTGYIGGDIIDLDDGIIAPGFLDLYGRAPPPQGAARAAWLAAQAERYVRQGVTGFWTAMDALPEDTADEELTAALEALSLTGQPAHLGVHLTAPTAEDIERITAASDPLATSVKLATLHASQLDQISALADRGIKVAMTSRSSSTAPHPVTYSQAESALYAGATALADPLDSATAPLTSADPGPAGLLMLHDRVAPFVLIPSSSSNGAGAMHSKAVALLFRAATPAGGTNRAVLCTPPPPPPATVAPTGTSPATHAFASSSSDDTAAAAAAAADIATTLRSTYYGTPHSSLAQAAQSCSESVARFMGVAHARGRLAEGCRADFVVLDDGGNVRETWIAGRRVWPAGVDARDEEAW